MQTFYETDFIKLNSQIEFLFEKGPGSIPLEKRDKIVKAAIIPHSNYDASGVCASWAFKELGETKQPPVYVILGPLHNKISDKILISIEDIQTPFGTISVDKSTANSLIDEDIILNEYSHKEEYSINVQLPFLQYINKQNLPNLKILPILSSTLNPDLIKKTANILSKIENAIYLVSSNLLEYGPSYNYAPFKFNKERELTELTNKLLDSIANINSDNFLKTIRQSNSNVCGASSIAIILEILKNSEKGKILNHHKYEDKEDVLEFASIIYNRKF